MTNKLQTTSPQTTVPQTTTPLTLGLLDCDELAPELQQEFSCYGEAFEQLLSSVDNSVIFKRYQITQNEYPDATDACDGYLVTGSKNSVYDNEPWVQQLAHTIKALHQAKKKMIGICFGHQMIAHALGGATTKNPNGWGIGVSTSKIVRTAPWMQPPLTDFALLVSHQDQVMALPDNAQLIAGNAFCANASFTIADHVLTFQGHPEFTKSYSKQLMKLRRERIGEEEVNRGIASLERETDHLTVSKWILNFLKC